MSKGLDTLQQVLTRYGIPNSIWTTDDKMTVVCIEKNNLHFDEFMAISKVVKIHMITANDDNIELIIKGAQ